MRTGGSLPAGRVIQLRDVTKIYDNGVSALGPLDLNVEAGEFISLVGPSGCGKSTLLRIIAGLNAPTCGVVDVAGSADRSKHNIGFVFQEPTLMPWATVSDNVSFRLSCRMSRATSRMFV